MRVSLLGSVASTGITVDKSQNGQQVATFNLLTRARYRSADRYMMKLVYHRIHVFDKPLIERIKNIAQGDRVFVLGCLTSFKKSSNDWMQCITAQNVILHADAGKPPQQLEEEEADGDGNEDAEESI
ncbi:unnamed protein product [Mesocestoides corti]|uniref:Single-stranded DNA-binding protein n=1 Tax=Mesocestoides corti TaxID=53468 RepID=A0A0R3U2G7_MESCO|nr:unnamed protein product [Mesocestoides corti]